MLSSFTYLSEAESFLEQYAKRSQQNQALIGSAGSLVSAEDFMAIIEGGRDEEGDLDTEKEEAPPSQSTSTKDTVAKDEGLIVFFPGIFKFIREEFKSLQYSTRIHMLHNKKFNLV